MILSAFGAPEIPAGGSAWSRLKSLTRRLRAAVDCAPRGVSNRDQNQVDFRRTNEGLVMVSVDFLTLS
jgi:hypothetical protein